MTNKEYLVIFDFDGVIVDSAPYFVEIYRKICLKYDKTFPIKDLNEYINWYDSKWENNFYRLGFTKEDIANILEYENNITNYDEINLFPGVREILLELKKNYYMAIASTTPSNKIRKKLQRENLDGVFSIISGGEDGISDKKDKIQKVIEEFNMLPEKCIMIGDTVMDIVSSKGVGIKCIALSCGWNTREKLEMASPYRIVDNHRGLISAIKDFKK